MSRAKYCLSLMGAAFLGGAAAQAAPVDSITCDVQGRKVEILLATEPSKQVIRVSPKAGGGTLELRLDSYEASFAYSKKPQVTGGFVYRVRAEDGETGAWVDFYLNYNGDEDTVRVSYQETGGRGETLETSGDYHCEIPR